MRSVRVKCKNGKTRRDIDFIPREDFPTSMNISDSDRISKTQMKKRSNALRKKYFPGHENI